MNSFFKLIALAVLSLYCSACSGGGSGGGSDGGSASLNSRQQGGSAAANFDCDGACASQNLSIDDVRLVIANAVLGAQSLGVAATVAVLDRVGNVLAVYQMSGATTSSSINGQIGAVGGLEGLVVPAALAAISKAGTGAYLSSQGNAFSSRTASQIIQENFNPGERNQPGGPLFGVQFSQLLCSDVTVRNADVRSSKPNGGFKFSLGGLIGPRPLPLGLSADPGGLPLYKNGDLVGGIGVEFDGSYTLDRNISDRDDNYEERIALIGSRGFEAPSDRSATRVNVGKSLRYTDLSYDDLGVLPEILPELDSNNFISVAEFTNGQVKAGAFFGDPSSGYTRVNRAGVPAATLVFANGVERYPLRSGSALSGGAELKVDEVNALLDSALLTAFRGRAAIRRPLDTAIRVSIWVVDTQGNPLGFVRSEDAPVFGTDVALQKARTAAFISAADAGARLSQAGFGEYVAAARNLLGADALTGTKAFPDRAGGNLSRPFFTDGLNDNFNGPFSLPFPGTAPLAGTGLNGETWSPFNTGLQLDISFGAIARSLGLVASGDLPDSCADKSIFSRRLANGLQIFPGSVPLYRGTTLIGGIGVSGDGVDQDDMVAFLGASRQGLDAVGHAGFGDPVYGFNAPKEIRADTIALAGTDTRLRYVNCPFSPFRGSNEARACEDL